ncbi:MAG: formate dehydrogenase accessory sulfurtransferase FdhD [Firmicutes bacterium]|nr:formate dehydrogenase accessory sulfurtransferase FdhD [Bacillota bacterium]
MATIERAMGRWKWTPAGWERVLQPVAEETPLTLYLNGAEFVTIAVTPDHVPDLVLGFLASEGVIRKPDEVSILQWRPEDQEVWVRVPNLTAEQWSRFGRRALGVCCGKSRPAIYLEADAATTRPVPVQEGLLTVEDVQFLSGILADRHHLDPTGGLHMAALVDPPRRVLAIRADVGRHNALDKLFGYALRLGEMQDNRVVVFSGRISSEVLLKVVKMRGGVIVSNAGPTSLGVELAEELGVTAIGFARGSEFSIYTHPQRVVVPA